MPLPIIDVYLKAIVESSWLRLHRKDRTHGRTVTPLPSLDELVEERQIVGIVLDSGQWVVLSLLNEVEFSTDWPGHYIYFHFHRNSIETLRGPNDSPGFREGGLD